MKIILSWQEVCDHGLALKYAKLVKVDPNLIFEMLNGTDEIILNDDDCKELGITFAKYVENNSPRSFTWDDCIKRGI